jgi:hypothetical protein
MMERRASPPGHHASQVVMSSTNERPLHSQ